MPFWTPAPLWRDRTVIVVGGGASLKGFDFSRLRSPLIAVNAAGYDLPFADALFFFDTRFFFEHRLLVETWRGMVITPAEPAAAAMPWKVRQIAIDDAAPLAVGAPVLKRGRTAGHCAAIVAVALAARRVVLLGFDCQTIKGRSHYHDHYEEPNTAVYPDDFLPAWRGYRAEANAAGCEIVNAGPCSAITEFPFVSIDDILEEGDLP